MRRRTRNTHPLTGGKTLPARSEPPVLVTLKDGHVAPLAAIELLLDLERRVFHLEPVEGGRLRVTPPERLTEADRAAIHRHKPELLQLIAYCEHVQ